MLPASEDLVHPPPPSESKKRLATPSACYRRPKPQKCPKWLGEGAKGLLGPGRQSPLALVQKRVAPVQNRVWVVQKTLGRPLLPGSKTPFSTPNMTGRRFHRTMEMIPASPWQSKSPSASILTKQCTNKGTQGVQAEVRRGTSSIHFHCPAFRSSSHIGHGPLHPLLTTLGTFELSGSHRSDPHR